MLTVTENRHACGVQVACGFIEHDRMAIARLQAILTHESRLWDVEAINLGQQPHPYGVLTSDTGRFSVARGWHPLKAQGSMESTIVCIDNSEWTRRASSRGCRPPGSVHMCRSCPRTPAAPPSSCMDRSACRNGDYAPTRFQAQADAVNLLAGAKTQAHPENTVGVLTMAGNTPRVLVTPTPDLGKVGCGGGRPRAACCAPFPGPALAPRVRTCSDITVRPSVHRC